MDTQKLLSSIVGRFVGERRHRWLPLLTIPVFALSALLFWDGWRQAHAEAIGDQLQQYTGRAVQGVAELLKTTAERFVSVTREPMVLRSLRNDDDALAVKTINREWPQLQGITFYSPDLESVYSGDLARFGYGRLALLESVLASGSVRTLVIKDKGEARLGVAGLVRDDRNVLAIAMGVLPLSALEIVVGAATPPGGYLGLKQARFLVASHGDESLAYLSEAAATPIEGTDLRVVSTAPKTEIGLLASGTSYPVAVLLLIVGISALLLIRRMPKPVEVEHGPTLAEAAPLPESDGESKPKPKPRPVTQSLALDRSIFRAYDIRGVIGKTLDVGVARLIGRAIGSLMHEQGLSQIVVGRDGRLSGPDMVNGLIAGLRTTGCDVIDIGQAPTPVVYFAGFHLRTGSGVAVTGSHNPPDYNGFKIVVGGETLSGDAIQALYARIAENELYDAPALGRLERRDVSGDYVERIANDIQVEQRIKVVVDCGNGVAGAIAPLVLESIGCDVIPLFCEVDGEFPNHHPDPSDPANLVDLINMVQRMEADIGIAFDGDGDRLGVVTRDGEVIYPDRVLMLFAEDVLMRNPGACILYDVKCTGHLAGHVLRHGGSPVMWKTGHSLIKAKMRETEAELAGEMSGHFFFRERWYGFDDGIYAAARLLEILGARAESPEEIFAEIPKGFSTPELKIEMAEGAHYDFVERFRERAHFEGARIVTIDGVRADWPDGWGLLRASNTTPMLVLRFDADTPEALARVQEVFRTQIRALAPDLELPF